MILRRRIENLEAARGKNIDATIRKMAKEMDRYFASLSDEELDAMIAEDEAVPCSPELAERLMCMTDEELCRLILEGERYESRDTD